MGDLDDYLDPGETVTCMATYTVTAVDVGVGSVTNMASATVAGVISNTDTQTVNHLIADLTVTKSNNVSGSVPKTDRLIGRSPLRTLDRPPTFRPQVILSDALPGVAGYYGAPTVTNGSTPPTGTINCSITGTALSCEASEQRSLYLQAHPSVSRLR